MMLSINNANFILILTVLAIQQPLLTNSFRILAIFPHPGKSHWAFFRPVVEELVARGHHVTLLSYFPLTPHLQNASHRMHVDEYTFPDEGQVLTNTFRMEPEYTPSFYRHAFISVHELTAWGRKACHLMLNNPKIDQILEAGTKFDLLLTELFHTDCALGLAHRLNNMPLVGLSSCVLMPWHYDRMGLPDTPSYIPSEMMGLPEKMTFVERIANFAITHAVKLMYTPYQVWPDSEMLRRKFGPSFPDVRLLSRNTSLILVNQHYAIHGARPLPPNVIEVGGLHLATRSSAKPLDRDLQALLDSSRHGVIVMSFGSVVALDSLPPQKTQILMNVFRRLSQTVLIKWEEGQELVGKPDNVHPMAWLPQKEILNHPNVKVFFAHGGMLGTIEALGAGVPMVVTPIYGDQYQNGAVVQNRKAGVLLDYADWSEATVMAAIVTCLSEEYQINARRIAYNLGHSPVTPLDTAVWAIENTIGNAAFSGGHHTYLRQPYSVHLSGFVYHSLDAVLVIVTILMVCAWIVWRSLHRMFGKQSLRTTTDRKKRGRKQD